MIAIALQIAAIAIALALLLNGWRLYRGPRSPTGSSRSTRW
ncbi:hypothetical protein QP185_06885 [Sphingomonas aerolata]